MILENFIKQIIKEYLNQEKTEEYAIKNNPEYTVYIKMLSKELDRITNIVGDVTKDDETKDSNTKENGHDLWVLKSAYRQFLTGLAREKDSFEELYMRFKDDFPDDMKLSGK